MIDVRGVILKVGDLVAVAQGRHSGKLRIARIIENKLTYIRVRGVDEDFEATIHKPDGIILLNK